MSRRKEDGKSPFAVLEALRDALPPTKPTVRREDFPAVPPPDGPARAVVRCEERADETVTLVEELDGLPAERLEHWRRALQNGLAAKVQVEASVLVISGDVRLRVPDLLLRLGVRRVVQA